MSQTFFALTIYLLISLVGWITYAYIRPRVVQQKYRKLLILHLIYLLLFGFTAPFIVVRYFGIYNKLLDASLFAIAFGATLHHLSLLSSKVRLKGLISPKMHYRISHIIIFAPFGLAGLSGAFSLWPHIQTSLDLTVFLFWFIETEVFAILGLATGIMNINWFERK